MFHAGLQFVCKCEEGYATSPENANECVKQVIHSML